ncbi:MAG: MMPL family transporter [Halofilum sp. (in: g-proteobacteria)]|nr:MMPL family transporter [Halofilum sp. (in: g-proteobacteria)]
MSAGRCPPSCRRGPRPSSAWSPASCARASPGRCCSRSSGAGPGRRPRGGAAAARAPRGQRRVPARGDPPRPRAARRRRAGLRVPLPAQRPRRPRRVRAGTAAARARGAGRAPARRRPARRRAPRRRGPDRRVPPRAEPGPRRPHAPPAGGWRTAAGWPVLVALPVAPADDLDAQARAVARIESATRALGPGFRAELAGAPAIAVATRARIRGEALRISAIAALAVLAIIGLALRSARALLACALPVGAGLLAGTATVMLVFGQVHGITLAFAATLLGITADYPLHLLWHARHAGARHARAAVRRPLVLGAGSTAIAFAAIGIGGFPGLQQLAVLAAVGILVAAAVTLWVLPGLPLGTDTQAGGAAPAAAALALRRWPAALALALVAAGVTAGATVVRLDTDLETLSPIPAELRERDREARAAVGVGTPGHLVRVTAATRRSALERTERTAARLAALQRDGVIGHFSAVTALVPSAATQRERRGALPSGAELRRSLRAATAGLPLRAGAFEPFVRDVDASRELEPLGPGGLPPGFLQRWVEARLFALDGEWTSLVGLGQIGAPGAIAATLQPVRGASLLDVTAVTSGLVSHYQRAALVHFGLGLAAITVLLAVVLGDPRRAAAVLLTVAGAVGGTLALLALVTGPLNVFEVISLLLVTGLGLDYALFATGAARGRGSVGVCALSTVTVFGLLASASVPVLRDIGTTVALGTLLAWLLAVSAARPEGPRSRD